jgi:SPX domain protein involved in polyphosphate accumulation
LPYIHVLSTASAGTFPSSYPEKSFFTALDVELNKVESFYLDREQELLVRTGMLEQQLEELVGQIRKSLQSALPAIIN